MDNNRLVPSHAVKQGRRYRSYVTQQYAEASNGQAQPSPTLRLPAGNLERVVQERLKSFLSDPKALLNAPDGITDAAAHQRAFVQARQVADTWDQLATAARRVKLSGLLNGVVLHPGHIALTLNASALHGMLGAVANAEQADHTASPPDLIIPVTLKRAGLEMRLLVAGETETGGADPALVKLIAQAHRLRDQLLRDDVTAKELARKVGLNCSYVSRLIRLAYLALDIVTAILNGREPVGLTANRLVRDTRLPLDWPEQRRQLGFA